MVKLTPEFSAGLDNARKRLALVESSDVLSRESDETPDWIKAALKHGDKFAQAPDDFDPFASLEVRNELIEGLLPEYGIAFLAGKSSSGKTAVALSMAAAMVRGVEYVGKVIPKPVATAYFAYEGQPSVKARWKAICETVGDEMRGVPFYPFLRPFTLDGEHAWEDLYATVVRCNAISLKQHGVPLGAVFIDTVAASLMVTDENTADAWSDPLTKLHQLTSHLGIVVLPIVHSGKNDDENPIRGSSSAYSAADRILVVKTDQNEGDVKRRWLYLEKDKDGGEQGYLADVLIHGVKVGKKGSGAPLYAAVVDYDLDGDKKVAAENAKPREKPPTAAEDKVMRAIAKAAHNSGEEKPRQFEDGRWYYIASINQVEIEARKQIPAKNFGRDFEAGRNGLLTRDWLEMDDRKMKYRLLTPTKVPVNLVSSKASSNEDKF